MNTKDIRVLVKLMVDNDLSELNLEDGETKILLKRGAMGPVLAAAAAPMLPAMAAAPAPVAAAGEPAKAAAPQENLLEVRSPMVGTFYAAPRTDRENFTEVGASVTSDSVVCIIEAMKVMNEIKAELSGVVAEVCVKNAQPVEFGQVLFRVRPV